MDQLTDDSKEHVLHPFQVDKAAKVAAGDREDFVVEFKGVFDGCSSLGELATVVHSSNAQGRHMDVVNVLDTTK